MGRVSKFSVRNGSDVEVTRRSSTLSCLSGSTVRRSLKLHIGDVTRQQIYAWRHELKKMGLLPTTADTVFVPVETSAMLGAPLAREDVARVPALIVSATNSPLLSELTERQ